MRHEVRVAELPEELAAEATELVAEASCRAVTDRGRFSLVLAGGSTPRRLYGALAVEPRFRWRETLFLFGDERCVPPEHPRSNYGMVRQSLFEPLGLPDRQVRRMEGELDPGEAAERYQRALQNTVGDDPFDLVLLGLGADGHTASLFPGTTALDETRRRVVANHVPQLHEWRLTLTLPALTSAREILFLVSGADKAEILAEVLDNRPGESTYPAQRVLRESSRRTVLCDRAAAAKLP